ncbi:hypothetical protein ACNQFN_14790 [Thauera butanivorans]|uniref:hypothetical protein n=1 Tax=Thauera butanivorans TaxID=86174 RepID=UPI003AB1B8D4
MTNQSSAWPVVGNEAGHARLGVPAEASTPTIQLGGITLCELQRALLNVGRTHPDTGDVMRAACAILDEINETRSEMKVRAVVGRGHLSGGNIPEAMRMFDSVVRLAGTPGRKYLDSAQFIEGAA